MASPIAPMSLTPADEAFSLNLDGASFLRADQETAVPVTPRYLTHKKLEVVTSRRINFMAKVYNLASFVALTLSGIVIILARTTLSQHYSNVPVLLDETTVKLVDLTIYLFPAYFTIVDFTLNLIVFGAAVFLLFIFSVVLIHVGRHHVLNEQVWVLMLLVSSMIYLFPYEAIFRLRRDVIGVAEDETTDGFSSLDIFTCFRMSSFTVMYFLYFWLGSHSYRHLSDRVSIRDWKFYLPKIVVTLTYIIYKLCIFFRYKIVFSELPFASLVAFINLYARIGVWPRLGVVVVSILTAIELVMALLLSHDLWKTFTLLSAAEYTTHRTKILGFRFFLHQQIVFNTVYIATYVFLLFGLPIGAQILQFFILYYQTPGRGSYFDVQYVPFGLNLCVLAFITIEMYTNLPSNINVWKIFFPKMFPFDNGRDSSSTIEPIVYRNTEPPSSSGRDLLEIPSNCFVMQTNVELFNMAWFVYYHGTSKEQNVKSGVDSGNLKIRDSVYDKATDTRVIVAETADRIIFAFKGTSSGQNLLTDLKVNHRPLSYVLGSSGHVANDGDSANDGEREEDESNQDGEGEETVSGHQSFTPPTNRFRLRGMFRRAKVHAGFAMAYKKVKHRLVDVAKKLLREKERPLCFTGHSLGGALATLSSLDIPAALKVERDKVMVASFGSPRVGNDAFQEIYDAEIQAHWRFVAGGDVISRMPKIGYRHVGKKVMLTSTGELFIDPSALEVLFWHSQPASIVHHRKACYLLAIKAWCDQRGDYEPNFWPFPVSENDSRKFGSTFRKPNSQALSIQQQQGVTSTRRRRDRREKAEERARRLQKFADDIENLGRKKTTPVERWRNLVELALAADLGQNSSLSIETPRITDPFALEDPPMPTQGTLTPRTSTGDSDDRIEPISGEATSNG